MVSLHRPVLLDGKLLGRIVFAIIFNDPINSFDSNAVALIEVRRPHRSGQRETQRG